MYTGCMANEQLFHVGVKALIRNQAGECLVFYTDTKDFSTPGEAHYDLAGGRIENGQTPEEALRREIVEETGISDVKNIKFFYAVVSPSIQIRLSNELTVGLTLLIYEVTVPEGSEIVLSGEHTKYEWLKPEDAAKALEYKFGKEFSDQLRDV